MAAFDNHPARIHIAILKKTYLERILTGRKTIECRLSKNACRPYNSIAPGDRIFLKVSGGPVLGQTQVERVIFRDQLTPDTVEAINQQYNDRILGSTEFWESKRNSRFATLIFLKNVKKNAPYRLKTRGQHAWHTLPHTQFKKMIIKEA